jgi:hypothetical protein
MVLSATNDQGKAHGIRDLLKAKEVLQRFTSDQQLNIVKELEMASSNLQRGKHLVIEGMAQTLWIVKKPEETLEQQEQWEQEQWERLTRFNKLFDESLRLEDDEKKVETLGALAEVLDQIDNPRMRTRLFGNLTGEAFKVIRPFSLSSKAIERFAAGLGSLTYAPEKYESIAAYRSHQRAFRFRYPNFGASSLERALKSATSGSGFNPRQQKGG